MILRQVAEAIAETDRGGGPALMSLITEPDSGRIRHDEGDAAKAGGGNARRDTKRTSHDSARREAGLDSPTRESPSVAPGRELRPQRLANTDQCDAASQLGKADVLRGHANPRAPELPLTLVDRFPAFLQWREVPPGTRAADDPEPPPGTVERKPLTHVETRQEFIAAE